MRPDRRQALDYLCAPADGLWHWAENGTVVVWKDGTTVAFREEVMRVLEWLAPGRLPPFGAIVLLLAACKGRLPAAQDVATAAAPAPLPRVEAALTHLGRVAALPPELRAGVPGKCVLAEAVFEPTQADRHADASRVLRGMHEAMTDEELREPRSPEVRRALLRQLLLVAGGLRCHTPESLALRLRTGLDALPQPAPVPPHTARTVRRLIEDVSRDPELGSLARAARELLAAVRLPRRLNELTEIAVGGVSDLGNRGPLDRLLLSELAQDDLTLAVRLALNEALYLRREPPACDPPTTLALLLDSGVRLWGIPRVLAAAAAMALLAREKPHSTLLAWRASGNQIEPIDLFSSQGLTEHLGVLETDVHPGAALPGFARAIAAYTHTQSVLITHADALKDPECRSALAGSPAAPGFVATVDGKGRFELHALPLSPRHPLCAATLDVETIFADRRAAALVRSGLRGDLPAIFGMRPFPFLLPVEGRVRYWTEGEDGQTYVISRSRELSRFRDAQSGARVLSSQLPPGRTLWLEWVDGVVHLVKAGPRGQPAQLVTVTDPPEPPRVVDLPGCTEVLAVHRCGDVILVLCPGEVVAFSLGSAHLLSRIVCKLPWLNSRFYRAPLGLYFAAWNGDRIRIEPVTMPKGLDAPGVLQVFDRQGHPGPWVVHESGMIASTTAPGQFLLPLPSGRRLLPGVVLVSRDGHRVHAAMPAARWACALDLRSGTVSPLEQRLPLHLGVDPGPVAPSWRLFRAFDALARLPDGLALLKADGSWQKLSFQVDQAIRIGDARPPDASLGARVRFGSHVRVQEQGCTLRTATWEGGDRAYLDNRGLLHLRSRDPNVPEVSLLLADGEVAGWTSDGLVCGPPFFFDPPAGSAPAQVFERVLQCVPP